MSRKRIIMSLFVFCLITLSFTACKASQDDPTGETVTPQESIIIDTAPTIAATLPETEPETEPPTEAPDLSIPYEPGSHFLEFKDPDTDRYMEYWLFVPENATQNMPLVIFLHGDGEIGRPNNLENYGFIAQTREIYGENYPYLVISPCTRVKSWVSESITTTLKGLIDHISETCTVDSIIITGHSRGGYGVWKMVSLYGDFFSRAVPVSNTYISGLDFENCAQVPIKAQAGTVGSFERECVQDLTYMCERVTNNGGFAEITVLEGMDHSKMSTAPYTEELIQWMILDERGDEIHETIQ